MTYERYQRRDNKRRVSWLQGKHKITVQDVPHCPRRGLHTIEEEQESTPHLLAGPEDDTDDELMEDMRHVSWLQGKHKITLRDVLHCPRRGLHTIEEEQESNPHLLVGPEDDTDDELMDNMDLYFPRQKEENEWDTHFFLAVTETDDVLVDDADEPIIHHMNMNNTTAFLEEASSRSRPSTPPLVEECDDGVPMKTGKGVPTENNCATKSDRFAISESTVVMEVPVTTNSKLKRKRHRCVPTEKDCATKSDGFAISESTVVMEVPVTTNSKLKRERHRRAQYVLC
jgi:hypothetical protein